MCREKLLQLENYRNQFQCERKLHKNQIMKSQVISLHADREELSLINVLSELIQTYFFTFDFNHSRFKTSFSKYLRYNFKMYDNS